LEKLQRILQYLKGCPNDGITLRGEEDLTITAYADESFWTHAEDCLKMKSLPYGICDNNFVTFFVTLL
jgi:hypothetical protein